MQYIRVNREFEIEGNDIEYRDFNRNEGEKIFSNFYFMRYRDYLIKAFRFCIALIMWRE